MLEMGKADAVDPVVPSLPKDKKRIPFASTSSQPSSTALPKCVCVIGSCGLLCCLPASPLHAERLLSHQFFALFLLSPNKLMVSTGIAPSQSCLLTVLVIQGPVPLFTKAGVPDSAFSNGAPPAVDSPMKLHWLPPPNAGFVQPFLH